MQLRKHAIIFSRIQTYCIFAEPFAYNIASCKVLEKAGYIFEGTLRKNAVKNGEVLDMKMYASDKRFIEQFGFNTVYTVGDEYILMALSFDGTTPRFANDAKIQKINHEDLTIYYSRQCPYIPNCIEQIDNYCKANNIPITLIAVDTIEKAKSIPCVFNNWAVFYNGKFETVHLLNEGYLKKMLER